MSGLSRPSALIVLGFGALLLTVGYGLAPVQQQRHIFEWSPSSLASERAVAPLALAHGEPDAVTVTLPCDVPGSGFSSMNVWAWWSAPGAEHSPLQYQGFEDSLELRYSGSEFKASVAGRDVAAIGVTSSPGCLLRAEYEDGLLTLRSGDVVSATAVGRFRLAEAALTGPAASDPATRVQVITHAVGSSPSTVQWVLLVGATGMLLVLGRELLRPRRGRAASRVAITGVDIAVIGVLVLWWLLAPVNIDDGWTGAMQRRYGAYGDFSWIFTSGSAAPMGYWLNWIQNLWLSLFDGPALMRLPALGLGTAGWLVLRRVAARAKVPGNGGSVWVMAGVYSTGFLAWGMTVRPEPFVVLIVAASLGWAVRATQEPSVRVLVWWGVTIALGLSAHPTGLLVLAPVIAAAPATWRRIRADRDRTEPVAAVILGTAALTGLLVFLDSNLAGLLERVATARATGPHTQSVLEELNRYSFMGRTPYATIVGRVTVALVVSAAVAFLFGRARARIHRLAGATIVASLGLLALIPSKWPVHFAGLIGPLALFVSLEVRWRARRRIRASTVVVGAVAGALVVHAWSVNLPWNAFDLIRLRWWPGLDLSSAVVWLVLVLVAVTTMWVGRHLAGTAPEALLAVMTALAVGYTAVVPAADAVITAGWNPTRGRVESLIGSHDCGLADRVAVPAAQSLGLLSAVVGEVPDADADADAAGFGDTGGFAADGWSPSSFNDVLPVPEMPVHGSWIDPGDNAGDRFVGSTRGDWYRLTQQGVVALMVMGGLDVGSGNAIAVQFAAGTESIGIVSAGDSGYYTDWSLRVLRVPNGADRARVLLRDDSRGSGSAWVAASAPLAIEMTTLAAAANGGGVVVTPPLAPYMPCIEVPVFEKAIVAPPGIMVLMWPSPWIGTFGAASLADRYFRVPVAFDPPARDIQIGAHLGDPDQFVFVSQEYLSGHIARGTEQFVEVGGG